MKIKKLATLLSAVSIAILSSQVAADTLPASQNSPSTFIDGHAPINNEWVELIKQRAVEKSFPTANTTSDFYNPKIIDVLVMLGENYMELGNTPLSEKDGITVENGAQFVINRIQHQLAWVNKTLSDQKVDAQLRLIAVTNAPVPTLPINNIEVSDFEIINDCFLGLKPTETHCGNWDFSAEKKPDEFGADLVIYLRELHPDDVVMSAGAQFGLIQINDPYFYYVKESKTNSKISQAVLDNLKSGSFANLALHEFGHFSGANHELRSDEPDLFDSPYHATTCDTFINPVTFKAEPKRTIMHSGLNDSFSAQSYIELLETPRHNFFSDPEKSANDEACGNEFANNIAAVRENAPLAADINDAMPANNTISFGEKTYTFENSEEPIPVVINRAGNPDITTTVAFVAENGSAVEGRDFNFGLQELTFAPYEMQKTLQVSVIDREEAHLDTNFKLKAVYASGATLDNTVIDVTIKSDNVLPKAVISMAESTRNVTENVNTNTLLLQRTTNLAEKVTVLVSTIDGTAKAGKDYTAISTSYTLEIGQESIVVPLYILNNDALDTERKFSVAVSIVSGHAELGQISQTEITIVDDEKPAEGNDPDNDPDDEVKNEYAGSIGYLSLLLVGMAIIRRRFKLC